MAEFAVHTVFQVDGGRRPSPRQFEALFHRLDYAVLDAQILTDGQSQSGWPPRRVAREALLRDPQAPYVLAFSYESPISSWLGDSNRRRAAAALVFLSLYFHAFEKAEDGLAGSIDGATEIVKSAEKLWIELETFGDEPRAELPPMQITPQRRELEGRAVEPAIEIQTLELRELDT